MADWLPDDVLREILARLKVDVAALFRCATACKRWCGLVADPSFLHHCWPDDACPSFFVGIFIKQQLRNQGAKVLIRTPGSVLRHGRRALSSFVPAVSPRLLHRAVPLLSRHGLLLVRLNLRLPCPSWNWGVVHLAVCNLLDGTCSKLPPLMCTTISSNDFGHYGCAVLAGDDFRSKDSEQPGPVQPSNSTLFKVVIITSDEIDRKFNLYTFASNDTSWSTHTEFLNTESFNDDYGWSFCQSEAVVHRGTSHWLCLNFSGQCFDVVNMNAQSGDFSLTRLPFPMLNDVDRPCLSLPIKGTLSVLRIESVGSQLEIWTQQQGQQRMDGTSEWLCTQKIELMEPKVEVSRGTGPYIFGERCGKLLVNDGLWHVYTAGIQTGIIEKVADWPRIHPICTADVVPLEINWPALFISRLGTIRYS
ncbi:unnamed protein product [Alopecurus aequalis]